MQAEISVIIPIYNAEQTLESCLDSITKQELPATEIILVDSQDSSSAKETASKYNANYINISENKIAKKRNTGAQQASGDLIVFLDADCLLDSHWLKLADELLSDQNVTACGSHYFNLPDNSSWITRTWNLHTKAWNKNSKSWLPTAALAVKKSKFLEIGGFNEELIACEDVDLGYRLSRLGQLISTDDLSYVHINNPRNLIEFFLKEIWRGNNSLAMAVKNKSNIKELVYLCIPLYTSLAIASIFAALAYVIYLNDFLVALSILLIFLSPILLISLYTSLKTKQLAYFPALFVAYSTYLLARSYAIIKSWAYGH